MNLLPIINQEIKLMKNAIKPDYRWLLFQCYVKIKANPCGKDRKELIHYFWNTILFETPSDACGRLGLSF
jgi:hypothetical protein